MDGLNRVVKAGKARYIGISNCFAWQLAKANALAEKEGFTKFVSVQGHYNLIFREEEREMAPYCREENIAMTLIALWPAGGFPSAPVRPPSGFRRTATPNSNTARLTIRTLPF